MSSLEKLMQELNKIYEKYPKFNYEVIPDQKKKGDEQIYKIKASIVNQKNKIRLLKKQDYIVYNQDESDEEYAVLEISFAGDFDFGKAFDKGVKEKDSDNSDEMWKLYISANKEFVPNGKKKLLKNIELSGDRVFNFNNSKCKYFKEIIDNDKWCDDDEKKCIREMLEFCKNSHDAVYNARPIIITGGLNQFKQSIANDRFDVFMSEILNYYMGNKLRVLENGACANMSFNNRIILEKNLDSFGKGIQGYKSFLNVFYHLTDESLIEALVDSGKERIVDCYDLYHYMTLALQYWIMLVEKYFSVEESRKIYIKMENALEPNILHSKYKFFCEMCPVKWTVK